MIKAARHDHILAELAIRGAISVHDLAVLLGASSATIRRDIVELDQIGMLLRTHGGAALRDRHQEIPYDAKVMAYFPEKRRIGAYAAAKIKAGTTVGCGGGTTVMQMIASIKRSRLHIVTTAVNVALELRDAPNISVLLTGGLMRARTAEVVGHVCERTLRDINLDLAIIGVDGVHSDFGLTTYDGEEAYTNRVLIDRAREVWILADRSKLGQIRPAVIHDVAVASLLITDNGACPDQIAAIRKKGTEVICV